jgi:biotin operon repressor
VGFAMTLTTHSSPSSGKSVSRRVPLDIDASQAVFGGGAFARTCSIVYSQLKYWWRYAKHQYDKKMWFYKSQRELGEELGMSEKTIWRAIRRLRELGLVLVEKHQKQFYRQVYFYHLCYTPSHNTATGASQPKRKSSSSTAASSKTNQPQRTRKNDGIKHKKNNPLEEIIRRATQHRTEGVGFGATKPIHDHNHNGRPCPICRNTGLVENDKNIAIRCECSAGDRYSHILPIAGEMKLSVA